MTLRTEPTARAMLPQLGLGLLPDAGHVPWLDTPDTVAATVDAFLRSGSARRP